LDKKAGCPNKGATCFFSNDDPQEKTSRCALDEKDEKDLHDC